MAVVVSDTTPLHYLILIDRETILEKLYGKVLIPPAVLTELCHPAAPGQISKWAANLPAWVTVASPDSIPGQFDDLDFGERQALAPAQQLHADLVLLDDKMARRVARRELMKVKGTLGVVADAARLNILDFIETVQELHRTSMHLDQHIVDEVIREYARSSPRDQS